MNESEWIYLLWQNIIRTSNNHRNSGYKVQAKLFLVFFCISWRWWCNEWVIMKMMITILWLLPLLIIWSWFDHLIILSRFDHLIMYHDSTIVIPDDSFLLPLLVLFKLSKFLVALSQAAGGAERTWSEFRNKNFLQLRNKNFHQLTILNVTNDFTVIEWISINIWTRGFIDHFPFRFDFYHKTRWTTT